MKRTISSKPERFFALHLSPGLAEYKSPKGEPFKVLVERDAAIDMDPTFEGCPVFVFHQDDVDIDKPDMDAVDGLVSKSFYNKMDGNHWVEFIAITDQAKEAIKIKRWRVSNCSITDQPGPGGKWQGSEYRHSIKKGHYEHLAIVPNPRYTQSVVLNPDEFREYNATLEEKLTRLNNSDEDVLNEDKNETGDSMKLKFLNIEVKRLENSDEISSMSVELPKTKKTVTVSEAVIAFDEAEHARLQNAGKPVYANDEDKVKLENGEEMSIKDCKKAMNAMKKKKNEDAEDELEGDLENAADEKPDDKDKNENSRRKNSDEISDEELRLKNDDDLTLEEAKRKLVLITQDAKDENFSRLKNAQGNAQAKSKLAQPAVTTTHAAVKAGENKYGSGSSK